MLIRIAGTVSESIVDGPGIRYTIFTQAVRITARAVTIPKRTISAAADLRIPTRYIITLRRILC